MVSPPECLPSKASSVELIEKEPENWVIKAPNLSGGTGVHILITLDDKKRKTVLQEARKNPEGFAYQRVVKIGRIPVAVKQATGAGYRFANLAADIRMWMFYGGNDTLPRLTHNALVRYAPKERGPMSSIVNTSKGGGYAPFVVVDDLNSPDAIPAEQMAQAKEPIPFQTALPAFVGAQLVQVANIVQELRKIVRTSETVELYRLSGYLYSLKLQVREIASYLHPRCMEMIYTMLEVIEKRIDDKRIALYFLKMNQAQASLVSLLQKVDPVLSHDFYLVLDELKVLNQDVVNRGYTYEMKRVDLFNYGHLSYLIRNLIDDYPFERKTFNRIRILLRNMIQEKFPSQPVHALVSQRIESLLDQFCDLTARRLNSSVHGAKFASLFSGEQTQSQVLYQETFVVPHAEAPRSATEWEMVSGVQFAESEFVEPDIKEARADWLQVLAKAKNYSIQERVDYLRESRIIHFEKHSRLREIQFLIDRHENTDIHSVISLMSVMPYAAYNIRQFAIEQGRHFNELFSSSLSPERICILDRDSRIRERLNLDQFSGECFAKKRERHGLVSQSDRYMWIAKEQSPLIQLYTIGHELIHAAQIKEVIDLEKQAKLKGPLEFARFLNYYGNFLSLAAKSLESHQSDLAQSRKPLFGLADRIVTQFFTPVIQDVREGLIRGGDHYNRSLDLYGSLFGYMMPVSNAVRAKALREVIPALENAKNIIFAKECGLMIPLDEVKSALPTANAVQLRRYRRLIVEAAKKWKLDFEALRVIASHQYHGVMFSRAPEAAQNLTILSDPGPIYLNIGYNQTQQ